MEFELRSLLVFRHLAGSGSFSETAKHWGISQPAVSLTISKLESALGLVLFERSPSGTRLTADGMAFLPRAEEVCSGYSNFIEGLRAWNRRESNEILIACDGSLMGMKVLRDLQQGLVANLPGRTITCALTENWGNELESSHFDLVVSGRFLRAGLEAGMQEAVLLQERGITIAWNPMFHSFNQERFSFPEILKSTVLLPSARVAVGFSDFFRKWCQEAYGSLPPHTMDFDAEQAALNACRSGLGVLVTPGDLMARLNGSAQDFASVRTFEFLLPEAYTFGIYCRAEESSKAVLRTAAALSAHMTSSGLLTR